MRKLNQEKTMQLIGLAFAIAESYGEGGIRFLKAREKYADSLANNPQIDRMLNNGIFWNAFKDKLLEAAPLHTRTIIAYSETPFGDLSHKEGKIWIPRTFYDESVRFGGFTENDLKSADIPLGEWGMLLALDSGYKIKKDGRNAYTIVISPKLLASVKAYPNVILEDGWHKTEPKHGLAIGEKSTKEDPDARFQSIVSEVGTVGRGSEGSQRDITIGDRFDNDYGAIIQVGPDIADLLAKAEKKLGKNMGAAVRELFDALGNLPI